MPWKKAWPSQVKDALRSKGVKDSDIATLEGYGSLEVFRQDPKRAMKDAKREELEEILRSTDVIDKQFLCSAEASRFPVPACHFGWSRAQRVVKTGRSPPPQAAWS